MRLLDSKRVAEIYGYDRKYFQNKWHELDVPKPVRTAVRGRLKWREEDVEEHYSKLAMSSAVSR